MRNDIYAKSLKIQKFSEELVELQESIANFDNEVSLSRERIKQEEEKISNFLSKKNDTILKIKSLNRKISLIKNEIDECKNGKSTGVGYVRLSKGEKNYERQYHTIYNSIFNILDTFEETVSATSIKLDDRVLNECIEYCFDNGIEYIVISEVSRLSRNTNLFEEICENLIKKSINVYSCSERIYLFDCDFNINEEFYNKVVYAEKEAEMIKDRLRQGLETFVNNGGVVGRKCGWKKPIEMYKEQYYAEINLLKKGLSLRKISDITGSGINTIRKVKQMFNISSPRDKNVEYSEYEN